MKVLTYISNQTGCKGCALTTTDLNFKGDRMGHKIMDLPEVGDRVLITINPYGYDMTVEGTLYSDKFSCGTSHGFKTDIGYFPAFSVKSWITP